MKNDIFVLDENKNVIPAPDGKVWGRLMASEERVVGRSGVPGHGIVNTVFIGIDSSRDGKGYYFTTEIFGFVKYPEERSFYYSTWKEAEEGHKKISEKILDFLSSSMRKSAEIKVDKDATK